MGTHPIFESDFDCLTEMGLLVVGEPLSWEETRKLADYVREHGLVQLVNIYNAMKSRCCDSLKWGDEIEYMLCKVGTDKVQLVCRGEDIFEDLDATQDDELWRPEFASYMLEGTPGAPYGSTLKDLLKVEKSMKRRRRQVEAKLSSDEMLVCYSTFPRLGCDQFTSPAQTITDPLVDSPFTHSDFFPESAVNSHPRFLTLARNIRQRRQRKVEINVPVFKDEKTAAPFVNEGLKSDESRQAAKDALHLYDQLIPLTPVMLALSAASPIFRGILADVDTRWAVIGASVDCRTQQEQGNEPLTTDRFRIPKSRYASVSS